MKAMSSKSHEAHLKRYEQIFFRWCLYDLLSSTRTKLLRYAIVAYEKLTTSVLCVLNFIIYLCCMYFQKLKSGQKNEWNSFFIPLTFAFRYYSVEIAWLKTILFGVNKHLNIILIFFFLSRYSKNCTWSLTQMCIWKVRLPTW